MHWKIPMLSRRNFIKFLGASSLCASLGTGFGNENTSANVVQIDGSWFEFQHHLAAEGRHWDQTLWNFTAQQWHDKVREIAYAGLRDLVLLHVAMSGKSFYPSALMPKYEMHCDDPLEVILNAADRYNINFFIPNDYFGDITNSAVMMEDEQVHQLRLKAMEELVLKYGHHKSFYGWYFPFETGINGGFDERFMNYINKYSAIMTKMTPKAKKLIAPYGTRHVKFDGHYVSQLESLDVDFIAYQDEVGVRKSGVGETASIFEQLRMMHDKAGRSKLWADVEVFDFEENVYTSALIPAPKGRVVPQLEAVSPFVEKILIYQYLGLMNHPGTTAFAGHSESPRLYEELAESGWLKPTQDTFP